MGYCYQGRKLVCDKCGTASAAKRRCPWGWCQAHALCTPCKREVSADGSWKKAHAACKGESERYAAVQAEKTRRLEAGEYLRSSAIGIWEGEWAGWVEVAFTNSQGADRDYRMRKETYDAFPLGISVSVEEYERHGEVIRIG